MFISKCSVKQETNNNHKLHYADIVQLILQINSIIKCEKRDIKETAKHKIKDMLLS